MVAAGDRGDPWRLVDDAHQRFAEVMRLEPGAHGRGIERAVQMQVRGEREAAEMRRDMRHELDRMAELARHLAAMQVAGQRVRHQVVAQGGRVVPRRRRRAGAGMARNAEALHRSGQRVAHRRDRQLHRGRVAARVGDAARAGGLFSCQLRQPVMPGIVEPVVGGKVDDDRPGRGGVDFGDERRRHPVRQREHERVDAFARGLRRTEADVVERAGVARFMRRERLPCPLPRRHESQFEPRVTGEQPHQFGASMAACADEADGDRRAHRAVPYSRRWSRPRRTVGHSQSRIE